MNKKEEALTLKGGKATVDLVLKILSAEYGALFADYVYEGRTGQPKGFLQFLVNGNSTSNMNGLQTELRDGDVLAILPPVGGG